jgi:hypothetical protein
MVVWEFVVVEAEVDSTYQTEEYTLTVGETVYQQSFAYNPSNNVSKTAAVSAFASWWVTGTSLDDNPYGFLHADLISEEPFAVWLANHLAEGASFQSMRDIEEFLESPDRHGACKLAEVCALIKCPSIGGAFNPVCHGCLGGALTCLLVGQ